MVVWPHGAHNAVLESVPGDCTGLPCRSLGSGVIKIGSDSGTLSISHLRLTQNVYTWCLNVNNLLMGASPYQRHHWDCFGSHNKYFHFPRALFGVILGHKCGA